MVDNFEIIITEIPDLLKYKFKNRNNNNNKKIKLGKSEKPFIRYRTNVYDADITL